MADDSIELFESWLKRNGTPDEVACFNRSVVEGFLAVAGGYPIEHEDVAVSIQLARDAGIAVGAIERLGALIVRFGSGETPPADAPPALEPVLEPVPPGAVPPPPTHPTTTTSPSAPVPPIAVTFRPSTPLPLPARARRGRALVAAAALAGLAIAGFAVVCARGSAALVHAEVARPAAAASHHVALLDLVADVPAGWQLAPSPSDALPRSAMLYRGGSALDPDQEAFVATVPLADELAAGIDIDDGELLHAARAAELGAATQVADGERYVTRGCSVVDRAGDAAPHTAMCRGVIRRAGAQVALRTYLRVGATRAVVAVFMAKPQATAAAADDREAGAIVASLVL